MSDSEDSDEEEVPKELCVQLGFLESYTASYLQSWGTWGCGKLGGRPVWLNPVDLPSPPTLLCNICKDPMTFLLQIYCPLDEPPESFHRMLYLFCCRQPECFDQHSIVCLRSQVAKTNPYIPADPDTALTQAPRPDAPPLCHVCGCNAESTCSKCRSVHYCSRAHQREDWKAHKVCCGKGPPTPCASSASLFPEYDIVDEVEELENTAEDERIKAAAEKATIWEDAMTAGGAEEEEDARLRQADYSEALGNEAVDPCYVRFLSRVRRGGEKQVLRYCRWESVEEGGGPLWMHSADAVLRRGEETLPPRIAEDTVPCCDKCGEPRQFEFQVMPQLLHYLELDKKARLKDAPEEAAETLQQLSSLEQKKLYLEAIQKAIDWGSLDVYTCTGSCANEEAYVPEYVFVQPPLAFMSTTRAASRMTVSATIEGEAAAGGQGNEGDRS